MRHLTLRHITWALLFAVLLAGTAQAKDDPNFGPAVDAFCAGMPGFETLPQFAKPYTFGTPWPAAGESCSGCHTGYPGLPEGPPFYGCDSAVDGSKCERTPQFDWWLAGDAAGGDFSAFCAPASNTAPTLTPIGAKMTTEGQLLTFTVMASDADMGDLLTLTASPLPTGATYTDNLNGTGTFDWTPQVGQAGAHNLTFTVMDDAAIPGTASELVAITVFSANQAPVLGAIGSQTVNEGALLTVNVSASDPDGDGLTLSASNLPTGAVFNDAGNGMGSLTWTPGYNQAGNFSVTVTVTDNGSPMLSDSETFMVTVGNVNRPPVLAAVGNQTVNEGDPLTVNLSASDTDGDGLSLTITSAPMGSTFLDNGNGTASFNWTPGFGATGNYSVSFTVTDDGGPPASDSETINIAVGDVNRAPVLTPIGNRSVNENQLLSFTVTSTDPDGDMIALTVAGLPVGATWNDNGDGTGSFDWTPAFNQGGNHQLSFTATDNGNPVQAASETIQISVGNVNRPPVLTPIGNQTVDEGVGLQLTLQSTDPDGDGLTLQLAGAPQGMALQDNGDGTGALAWTPGFGDAGNHTVTISVTDDGTPAAMDQEAVMISVGNVNRPPTLAPIGNRAGSTNQLLSFTVTGTDPDGDAVTCMATGVPLGASFNDNGDGTGTFSWTPVAGDVGSYPVTFTGSDGFLTASETITVSIGLVNNPPTLTPIGDRTVMQGQTLAFTVMAADPDGNALSLTASNLPNGASLTDNGDGTASFSWMPAANQTGSVDVTFSATDDGVPPMSDQEVVNLAIQGLGGAFGVSEATWWDTWSGHILVHGSGAPGRAAVEILDADSGQVLATLTANQGGEFRTGECRMVRKKRGRKGRRAVLACISPAQAPCNVQVRTGAQLSLRMPVTNAPAQCGPASPMLLSATGVQRVSRGRGPRSRTLVVRGEHAFAGEALEIRDAMTDAVLGTTSADALGRFKWTSNRTTACFARVVNQAGASAPIPIKLVKGAGVGGRKLRALRRRWAVRCASPASFPTPAAFGAGS